MARWMRVCAVVCGLALFAAGCSSDTSGSSSESETSESGRAPKDSIDVAFVYVGPVGDAGWTKRHDDGRKYMEEKLVEKLGDDNVRVKYSESILESVEASTPIFEKLCAEGFDLVFATSFGYGDAIEPVAPNCRETIFMHATGYKVAENVGTYFGAAEEARYLTGIAAAKASKSGKIGYVAAFGIPEVVRGINAFTLGAQSVNPAATVQVEWTSTWFDPDKERAAAVKLLDGGADVIAQHQDTPLPGEMAEQRGAKWVGYNDDMSRFAPNAWLTAPVWNWGPYYLSVAESVLDGTWTSEQHYGNMADGMVGLAPFGASVDKATQDLINAKAEDIKSGKFAPFTGPITDQAGATKAAKGDVIPLPDLLSMDYFVKGVVGEIPKT